jgi:hypothetical protein
LVHGVDIRIPLGVDFHPNDEQVGWQPCSRKAWRLRYT